MELPEAGKDGLSLIPYANDAQEIVLRHRGHVIVRDPKSQQLSLRQPLSKKCPTCLRPWQDESTFHEDSLSPSLDSGFHDPGYFRMLQHSRAASEASSSRPQTPNFHLLPPAAPSRTSSHQVKVEETDEDHASSDHQRISEEALSPGYFKRFFRKERELGKGGKGVVYLVRHSLDGVDIAPFACKIVPVGDNHAWLKKVLLEVKNLQGLNHRNLVSYNHVWLEDFQFATFGPLVPCAFILQEYCNGGDLHRYVVGPGQGSQATSQMLKDRLRSRSKGKLDTPASIRHMAFDEILAFFTDITEGLNHLHRAGFVHRDLKPSNCLLHTDERGTRVLVSDFGEMQIEGTMRMSTGNTGTISYCAPELLQVDANRGSYGQFTHKSDVFSLGMIVYFMCFRRLPYRSADGIEEDDEDLDQLRVEISAWTGLDHERNDRDDLPEQLFKSLKRLLSADPDARPSTDEILQSIKGKPAGDDHGSYSAGGNFWDPIGPTMRGARMTSPTLAAATPAASHTALPGNASRRGSMAAQPSSPTRTGGYSMQRSATEGSPSSLQSSIVLRKKASNSTQAGAGYGQRQNVRRLMAPPPRSLLSRVSSVLERRQLLPMLKLALFLLKIWSVFAPCSPYLATAWVSYPLVTFATLDLLGVSATSRITFVTSALHALVIGLALHYRSLCPYDPSRRYDYS